MAYSLKTVIDTWLKTSTAQGSTLPDDQRQFVSGNTVLPISSFELIGDDYIKATLGVDGQGKQIQFKGRNTWYIYRSAVQVLRDGQVILPTPTPAAPIYTLKTVIDTWLKTSTAQGSTLSDDQRQFVSGGTALPIASYAAVGTDHLKITLGQDAQGKQVQFKGRNTWYIYRSAVQILRDGQVIVPAPTPVPTPAPAPAPSTPVYLLKSTSDTWLKTSTAQGSTLPDDQRQFINAGTTLPLSSYALADNDHLKVTLGQNNQGQQVTFKGRNTWYIYAPVVQVLRNGQPIDLPTPASQFSSGKINAKGLQLLKSFEGLRLTAYQDSVGVWTIGYGTTAGVQPGMRITQAQAEELLKRDLAKFEAAVSEDVGVPLNDDQFSALVSFVYNVGAGAFAGSTLLALLNEKDYQGAADQFLRWNRAGDQELAGLTRRRRAERALFLGQDYTVFL